MRTVMRRGQGGGSFWSTMHQVVQLPESRSEITAIMVLCGLPWLLTGSIIAHEAMHAWLRLSGYPRLPPPVEEGMCQLMAMLWLEQQPAEPEVRHPALGPLLRAKLAGAGSTCSDAASPAWCRDCQSGHRPCNYHDSN